MTRQIRGPGTAVLEREYVYDMSEPPISFTELADKHGLARSNVAAKGTAGKWYEKRQEFRAKLKAGVREAMTDQVLQAEVAYREKLLHAGGVYLDKYVEALTAEDSKIAVNTKDMLGVAAMLRTIVGDMKAEAQPDTVVVTPGGDVEFADPDKAKKAMADLQRLLEAGDEPEGDDGD